MKELRKNKIRFKYVHGNIRGYRNEKKSQLSPKLSLWELME